MPLTAPSWVRGPYPVSGELEVTGVLRGQLRVLRSQSSELCRLPRCVLRSHARALLLRIPVLKGKEPIRSRRIREMLAGDFWEQDVEEMPYEHFPLHDILAEVSRRAEEAEERDRPLMEAISEWAERRDITLKAGDLFASHERPSDAERHAAQRLGVEISPLKLASRALWDHRNFDEERDRRVGDVDKLEPRSRQARRGLVTREMLAELQVLFDEIKADRLRDGDGER